MMSVLVLLPLIIVVAALVGSVVRGVLLARAERKVPPVAFIDSRRSRGE